MLKIEHLIKIFHGKKILHDLSLTVQPGEIALFLGASGVGKSTLLRVLNNLETIDAGSVTLNGKPLDLKKVNQDHAVGLVFQGFNLFEHLTVEQNITLALEKVLGKTPAQAHEIAQQLLAQYGLQDKAHHSVSQLSGGQKQRLAIARTLALKPKVICFDEPTSALDPLLTTQVARSIQELAKQGYVVLVATHDTSLLERLNCTLYLMQAGSLSEPVASSQFFADKSKYPQLAAFVEGTSL
ncbi:MAG TPA: ATP-binding cassette domain-containing protein [Candidatus Limnocylindria bacterium]|nr:ATP-binding cassette domain-containing protein [Candidatus Limnocylindria bacterium]